MVVNRMVFDLILVVSFASVCMVLAKGMALVFTGNINELFIYLLWTGTSSILLAGILFYFGCSGTTDCPVPRLVAGVPYGLSDRWRGR